VAAAGRVGWITLLGSALLLLSSCVTAPQAGEGQTTSSSSITSRSTTTTKLPPARSFRHVVVVVMENLSYDAALSTPGFAALAHRHAYLSDYFAVSHPSLPNYLALTAGNTFGITSDCLGCYVRADNLGSQLSAKGISWDAFMEDISRPCYIGTSYGLYAAKHDPFRYFDSIRSSTRLCRHILPLDRFYGDLRSGLPRFSFVTPNICNDGHDCSPNRASAWLSGFVGRLEASGAFSAGDVAVVTWDEGTDSSGISPSGAVSPAGGGGHVLTIVIDPALPRGSVIASPLNHYGLLATIEGWFGLDYLGRARYWRSHRLALPG
jgi:hypothetical protein